MIRPLLASTFLLALTGCALGNSAGGNLQSGGRNANDAGCGAAQANLAGGAGNGGVCLMPPCAIGSAVTLPNGATTVTITGWACNPGVSGSQPTGMPLASTPATAGAQAAALASKT